MRTKLLIFLLSIASYGILSAQSIGIKITPSSKYFLTMNNFSFNYGIHNLPFTKEYFIENGIKKMILKKEEKEDVLLNEFTFNNKGKIENIKNYRKKDKSISWTYFFESYSDSKRKYKEYVITPYGNLNNNYEYNLTKNTLESYSIHSKEDESFFLETSTKSSLGKFIIIKDDVIVSKCLLYLDKSQFINDKERLSKEIKTIYNKFNLSNRRGVNFEIITFKKGKIFEMLSLNYDGKTVIDLYDRITRFYYDNELLIKTKSEYFLSGEEIEVATYTYNKKNMPILIYLTKKGLYESKIEIKYNEVYIESVKSFGKNIGGKNYEETVFYEFIH